MSEKANNTKIVFDKLRVVPYTTKVKKPPARLSRPIVELPSTIVDIGEVLEVFLSIDKKYIIMKRRNK